jgi:glucokinase
VGVSSPGPLDTTTGRTLGLPTLRGFEDFPLKQALEAALQRPVVLENDGIAAAVGEWTFGAGQGVRNMIYVTVSTGIGGGVIVDGNVMRGRRGMAGHIGHMCIVPGGDLCGCGNRGCIEAYASGPNFARRARLRVSDDPSSVLHHEATRLDSRTIFAAAREGDRLANVLVDEEAKYLGEGFRSLAHILSPDFIVMGGGMSHEFERLQPIIADVLAADPMIAFRDVKLVKAALGQNSGLVGAAALAFSAARGSVA